MTRKGSTGEVIPDIRRIHNTLTDSKGRCRDQARCAQDT
jgi:hypothetical protein